MYYDQNTNIISFATAAEMASKATGWQRYMARECINGYDPKFYGRTTGSEAMRFAKDGNEASVPAAQRMLDKLNLEITTETTVDLPDLMGCYAVVPEFLSGEPECMRMPTLQGSAAAPLTVFLDVTTSMTITPTQYRNRGLAALALTMALTQSRPVTLEIGCVMGSDREIDGEQFCAARVRIETAPLDLATAAWMLTDTAAARRLVYGAAYEHCEFNGEWPKWNGVPYASPQSAAYVHRAKTLLGLGDTDLYLPAVCGADADATLCFTQPIEWVRKKLQEHGAA